MAVFNLDPVYGKTQRTAFAIVGTDTPVAATDLDDTPTGAVQLNLNGANGGAPVGGCMVTSLIGHLVNPALTTAAVLKLYLSKNGVNMYLLKDIPHAAVGLSATVNGPDEDFGYSETKPLRLEEGDRLFLQCRGATNAAAFHFTAQYSELQQ